MAWRVGRTYRYIAPVSRESAQCRGVLAALLLGLVFAAAPAFLAVQEREAHAFRAASREIVQHVTQLDAAASQRLDRGLERHVVALRDARVSLAAPVEDAAFRVSAANAIRLARDTQYCQWVESRVESRTRHTRTRADGSTYEEDEVEVTFIYHLDWVSHLVPSLLFDQPLTHHNPLRDPYPSHTATVAMIHAGQTEIHAPQLEQMTSFRPLSFESSYLDSFYSGVAAREHGFRYVGDGWFYSKHEEDTATFVARMVGQALEGTLLDYQIGDLFKHCSAGDIRVRFSAVTADSVSALGVQVGSQLTSAKTSAGEIFLIEEGDVTGHDLLQHRLDSHARWVLAARIVIVVWGVVLFFARASMANEVALGVGLMSLGAAAYGMLGVGLLGWSTFAAGLSAFALVPAILGLSAASSGHGKTD